MRIPRLAFRVILRSGDTIGDGAEMTVRSEMVTVTSTDEYSFDAFVAHAPGESKGGLVILHEIFAVTDSLKAVARYYAENGFDAIVPALFDPELLRSLVSYDNAEARRAGIPQPQIDRVIGGVDAARDHIDQGAGASVLGFCFGGRIALKAAATLSFKSAVSYHGATMTGLLDAPFKCPTLFHIGEVDVADTPPVVIAELRKALRASVPRNCKVAHAVANAARTDYLPVSAKLARGGSLAFLNRHHDDIPPEDNHR